MKRISKGQLERKKITFQSDHEVRKSYTLFTIIKKNISAKMSKWRFFVFCFSIVVLQVNGHNYGAPQAACDTMIPRHTPNIQQEGASRHSFTTR